MFGGRNPDPVSSAHAMQFHEGSPGKTKMGNKKVPNANENLF